MKPIGDVVMADVKMAGSGGGINAIASRGMESFEPSRAQNTRTSKLYMRCDNDAGVFVDETHHPGDS